MSNANTSSSGDDEDHARQQSTTTYTQEQKIVSAVWVHERGYNGQTFEDIKTNFQIRFKLTPPKTSTFRRWERRLFTEGLFSFSKGRAQRASGRLMHVPYVKASFREKPNLTLGERAKQLGLSQGTLRTIIKEDLKESDIKPQSKENTVGDGVKNSEDINKSESSNQS